MRRRFLSYSARSSAVNRNVQVFVSPGSMAKLGEAAELLDGRRHAADHVLEVELDGLLAGTVAGVFYLELNHEPFGRSDCPCAQSKPAILELGVLPRQPRSAQILQPIRSSNSRSRLPGDQRSTMESTEIHGKENPNQLPLSVSFPGATPARRVGWFRGYAFVMIFLAGVIPSPQPSAYPFQSTIAAGWSWGCSHRAGSSGRPRPGRSPRTVLPRPALPPQRNVRWIREILEGSVYLLIKACTNREAARRSGFSTIIRTTVTCRRPMATRSSWPGRRVSRA